MLTLVVPDVRLQCLCCDLRWRCVCDKNTFLSEGDPEPVHIADDGFVHAIECVVWCFDDINSILQSLVKFVHIVGIHVKIDFAAMFVAWFTTFTEHDLSISERDDGEAQSLACVIAVGSNNFETYSRVPIDGRTNVGHVDHWNDSFRH